MNRMIYTSMINEPYKTEDDELPPIKKFKKTSLTPLEELIITPANDSSRYKDLPIEDSIKIKIFGKL
jgi:hypothetical protein